MPPIDGSSRTVASPSTANSMELIHSTTYEATNAAHHKVRIGATFCRFHDGSLGTTPGAEPFQSSRELQVRQDEVGQRDEPPADRPARAQARAGTAEQLVVLGQAPLPDDREDEHCDHEPGRDQEREPEEGVGVVDPGRPPVPGEHVLEHVAAHDRRQGLEREGQLR